MLDTGPQDPNTRTTRIGTLAMELSALIANRFGEDASVGAVAIVCDVVTADEDGNFDNPILAVGSDPRHWLLVALLEEGLEVAKEANGASKGVPQDTEDAEPD